MRTGATEKEVRKVKKGNWKHVRVEKVKIIQIMLE
jgi:hypothetical protein